MFVRDITWNAASPPFALLALKADQRQSLAPAFHALAAMLPVRRVYAEWETGDRDIRIDNGFIMMSYIPPS